MNGHTISSYPWHNFPIFILKIVATFSSVQLLSRIRLFVTPWIAARQASLLLLLLLLSRSVLSYSVLSHRRQPTRLTHPWDSPGKNTGQGCHFLLQCMKLKSESEVSQSCPTLSDPMYCSLPGSSVHGIFQARVLEWGAIAFSENCLMTQQSHCRAYTPRKPKLKETCVPQCSSHHCLQ